ECREPKRVRWRLEKYTGFWFRQVAAKKTPDHGVAPANAGKHRGTSLLHARVDARRFRCGRERGIRVTAVERDRVAHPVKKSGAEILRGRCAESNRIRRADVDRDPTVGVCRRQVE